MEFKVTVHYGLWGKTRSSLPVSADINNHHTNLMYLKSINQSINQLINQSINQTINQSIK